MNVSGEVFCVEVWRLRKNNVSLQSEIIKTHNVMTAITINIPNHEVGFFKKMIAKMGWTYSEVNMVRSAATPKEKALAKVDHAFGQLRQMKEGKLQGVNADDLLLQFQQENGISQETLDGWANQHERTPYK